MFNPERLELARKRRALTMKDLAERCEVTTRAVSAWESGAAEPRAAAQRTLSMNLGFPLAFFKLASPPDLTAERTSFRALTSMTARERDQALAAGALAFELSSWLTDRFDGPRVDVPSSQVGTAEQAAEAVRRAWCLGDKPISNVIHLLESRGVRVFSLVEGTRRLDAFATWYDHAPYAFLNTTRSAERGRFDLAHELGHLVMHKDLETVRNRAFECEADRFGGAFLMPASGIYARVPRRPTIEFVMIEKHYWGVPAMAYVHRLHELGLLTDWHYRSYCVELTKHGYRLEEPDGAASESSLLLAKVFELLRSQQVRRSDVASALNLAEDEIDQLVFGLMLHGVEGSASTSMRRRGHLQLA
jgi:Zn-dependent peptidase ImmA (M78 family)/DNA-binding XRE family transcriptional regulator